MNWIKYDPYSREIESHVDHLITDGNTVWVAYHAKLINGDGYGWHDWDGPMSLPITHYAKIIFPPKAIDSTEIPSAAGAEQ